jgi:outer membrane protein OmpA-like peptidoglycan-associated protein
MTISLRARVSRALVVVALAASIGGCAYNKGTVVLLPEEDGHDTAVEVKDGNQTIVLDKPYAATRQWPMGAQAYTSDPKEVDAKFGAALKALPPRSTSFTLNFVEGGKDEFTAESTAIYESVFAKITKYPVADLVVVGHTDTVGSDAFNDALSLSRAEYVRTLLIQRGIARESITVVGRGKRELLVKTAAGVAEPRNRRVEIIVR